MVLLKHWYTLNSILLRHIIIIRNDIDLFLLLLLFFVL